MVFSPLASDSQASGLSLAPLNSVSHPLLCLIFLKFVTLQQPEDTFPPVTPGLLPLLPGNYLVLSKEIQKADSSLFNHFHQACQLSHKGTCLLSSMGRLIL